MGAVDLAAWTVAVTSARITKVNETIIDCWAATVDDDDVISNLKKKKVFFDFCHNLISLSTRTHTHKHTQFTGFFGSILCFFIYLFYYWHRVWSSSNIRYPRRRLVSILSISVFFFFCFCCAAAICQYQSERTWSPLLSTGRQRSNKMKSFCYFESQIIKMETTRWKCPLYINLSC